MFNRHRFTEEKMFHWSRQPIYKGRPPPPTLRVHRRSRSRRCGYNDRYFGGIGLLHGIFPRSCRWRERKGCWKGRGKNSARNPVVSSPQYGDHRCSGRCDFVRAILPEGKLWRTIIVYAYYCTIFSRPVTSTSYHTVFTALALYNVFGLRSSCVCVCGECAAAIN